MMDEGGGRRGEGGRMRVECERLSVKEEEERSGGRELDTVVFIRNRIQQIMRIFLIGIRILYTATDKCFSEEKSPYDSPLLY